MPHRRRESFTGSMPIPTQGLISQPWDQDPSRYRESDAWRMNHPGAPKHRHFPGTLASDTPGVWPGRTRMGLSLRPGSQTSRRPLTEPVRLGPRAEPALARLACEEDASPSYTHLDRCPRLRAPLPSPALVLRQTLPATLRRCLLSPQRADWLGSSPGVRLVARGCGDARWPVAAGVPRCVRHVVNICPRIHKIKEELRELF